jgi:2-polyprenyl-3-methyl-5-hydroxy-6-metoxy-1,4-benzoquinol methylase
MTQFRKKHYINEQESYHCYSCDTKVNVAHYEYVQDDKISRIYRCSACGLMFAKPMLLDDISSRQLDSIGDGELFHNALMKKLHENLIINREIRSVKKFLGRDTFTALDIGCGTGWISSLWKHAGADVVGLEPSIARSSYAREHYGIKVISSYLEGLPSGDTYDVVIMRHVLEHLPDPFAALEKSWNILRQDGLLVIIVPNIDCIGRYLFESKWPWVLPSHCIYFNPRALRSLAVRAGFSPVRSYQTPSPLWYPESFLRLIPGTDRLRSSLYHKLNFLALIPFIPLVGLGYLTGLSDNLTLIARKI